MTGTLINISVNTGMGTTFKLPVFLLIDSVAEMRKFGSFTLLTEAVATQLDKIVGIGIILNIVDHLGYFIASRS